METQRLRRRRSRRKARKKQVVWLTAFALLIGIIVWTRILIERRHDETLFIAGGDAGANANATPDADVKPTGVAANAAKNLILFVGNGYGIVPMTATRVYSVGEKGELAIDRLPQTALVRTSSRNAQTADDAAAMSAYMTGLKVDNGVLSQTADTRPYDETGLPHATHGESTCPTAGNGTRTATLLELAKASGRATGIVTTARVTEPTTAASYAHLCNRGAENSIAVQLVPGGPETNRQLGEGIDVVLGGGWQSFLPKEDPRGSSRSDTRDLFAEMRARGYTVINRQVELAALGRGAQAGAQPVGRLIGLFNRSRMSFDIDRAGTNEPSLVEMTTRAIELLQRNPAGYLLIVEGGRIGDAFDRSQARKGLHEARAFDDAVNAAIEQVRALDPELRNTVIVVTANHDHTLTMNGNSAPVGRTTEIRPGVLGVVHGYDQPSQIAVDAAGRPYTTLAFGTGEKRVKGPRSAAPAISDLVLGDRDSRYEAAVELPEAIGGADVMLGAIGQYADRFHGTLENTQVFALMREGAGVVMASSNRLVRYRLLAGIGAALALSTSAAQSPTAQNVIVLIGTGLGPAATTAARLLRYRDEGLLAMDGMTSVARVRTSSLDAQGSDSAAAVSALLTGVKVRNDVVAMDATTQSIGFAPGRDPIRNVANAENRCPAKGNGEATRSLLEFAIAKNRSTGIVTTGRLTGGPAAAAYAHVCHRDAEFDVARQAVPGGVGFNGDLARGVDVMMGGASAPWRPYDAARRPRGRPDGRELIGELQTLGYAFVSDLTTLNALPRTAGSRVIGLFDFSDDGMSYDVDRDPKREPSLAEMTSKAIEILATNRNGYVLVVEGGRIDAALRAANSRRALVDTIAFDDAVKVALTRADRSNTLIVVTGDHDSTMALIGGGRRSSDVLGLHLNPVTGKPDVDANGATYPSIVFGTGPNRPDRRTTLDTASVVSKDSVGESVVKLASGTSGGGDVILRASGVGASTFHGTIDNTRVLALIRKAAGL